MAKRRKVSWLDRGDAYWQEDKDRKDEYVFTLLRGEYQRAIGELEPLWLDAYRRLQEARDSGLYDDEYLSGLIWQERRLSIMLAEAENRLVSVGRFSAEAVSQREIELAAQARQRVADLIATELAVNGVPANVIASYMQFPVDQFELMSGRVNVGPLRALIADYGSGADVMRQTLVTGVALGLSPREVARRMSAAMGGHYGKMETIARTEMLRTYRTATQQMLKKNSHLVKGWRWKAALSTRTCPVCWAMHGTVHDLDESMDTHPVCRCNMVPVLRPWAEIDPMLSGVPDFRSPPSGVTLFRKLPEVDQRAILGPTAFRAYREGKLKLPQLVKKTWSDQWGGGRKRRPLREIFDDDTLRALQNRKPKPLPKPKPPTGGGGAGSPLATATPVPTGSPRGTQVSSFLDFDNPGKAPLSNKLMQESQEAAKLIDRVHGDGQLPRVPVQLDNNAKNIGTYYSQYSSGGVDGVAGIKPVKITMSRRNPTETRLFFAHETGHYLDQQMLGRLAWSPTKQGYASKLHVDDVPGMRRVMDAIDNSAAIAKLKEYKRLASKREAIPYMTKEGVQRTALPNARFLRYALEPEERFARAYAQYIATRSGDPTMLSELNEIRRPTGLYPEYHWTDEDFEPIAEALDELFRIHGGRE